MDKLGKTFMVLLTAPNAITLSEKLAELNGIQPSQIDAMNALKVQQTIKSIVYGPENMMPSLQAITIMKLSSKENGPETEFLLTLAYNYRDMLKRKDAKAVYATLRPEVIERRPLSEIWNLRTN